MRYRALLLLGFAIVLGGLAVYLVNLLVSQQIVEQADLTPQAVQPAVVAAIDLPVGLALEPIHLRVAQLPLDAYPEGSYTSVDELLAIEPSVITTSVSAGEIVLPTKLSTGVPLRGLTTKIPDGFRAISIPVNEVRGVGGFVLPGDRVDVLHTTTVGRRDEEPVTRTLLQDMIVLGVDQVSSETEEDPMVVNVVTLLVNPEEAKKLTLAQQVGDLTLSLRNEGDSEADGSITVALSDLWDYGPDDVGRVAPSRGAGAGGASGTSAAASTGRRSVVEIIRGLLVTQEAVPSNSDATADADASN